MLTDILILICSCTLTLGQSDETSATLPDTVFGENTFLPEIIPQRVHRSLAENGDISITINVLYTEPSIISWVVHGPQRSYLDRINIVVGDSVPSEYTLNVTIPRDVVREVNVSRAGQDGGALMAARVLILENEEFLVDYKELYIKFQTVNFPEAAVLKISLDDDDVGMETADNETDNNGAIDGESVPNFPEMLELEKDIHIISPGSRTEISSEVLFTDNDRYSVRGLVYNSTSNRLFTTFWSTTYLFGQSDFQKILQVYDAGSGSFDDKVKLIDNFDSQEASNVRHIHIDIPTDKDDISGVFTIRAHHEASIGMIVESTMEQAFIVQRSSQEHGPIPTGLLEFEGGTHSQVFCHVGLSCLVSCQVYGVGVQHLQLMHKDAESEFVNVPRQDMDYGQYESVVMVLVDSTNPANSGTYLCRAESGPLSITKEIDVDFVEK